MCSICNCFAWALDLFQRALTFCLSCWLTCAVCCGLLIAVTAGIAYGYNYSLAEFVTLTRSDIRVYMRRGQFYDKPDLLHRKNRRMGDEEEVAPFSSTDDYQQEEQSNEGTEALNKWLKDQDTRKYAEKLIKYSENRKTLSDLNDQAEQSKDSFFDSENPSALILSRSIANSTIFSSHRDRATFDFITRTFETLQTEESDSVKSDQHHEAKVNKVLDRALAKTYQDEEENAEFIPSDRQISQKSKRISFKINSNYELGVTSDDEQRNQLAATSLGSSARRDATPDETSEAHFPDLRARLSNYPRSSHKT